MLEFKNVSKSFGKIKAIEDINFSVEEGEMVFIMGPSGAGKTTLLKLLIKEYAPSSGEIIFDGKNLSHVKRRGIPVLRRQVGSVFQDFKLLYDRTIRENVEIGLAIKKVPRKDWRAPVDEVLDIVGLSERSELFPNQLSGGELQRAVLARALIMNPKIIFADEPTGNLDDKTAAGIMDLLAKINETGKTILVTTHSEEFAKKYADRIVRIEKGTIVEDSGPKKKSKKEDKKE